MTNTQYIEPTANVLIISEKPDATVTGIQVSRLFSDTLYPAGLYNPDSPDEEITQLHKVIRREGNIITYETYEKGHKHKIGQNYIWRVWWTPDQLETAMDTTLVWVREKYPDNGSHDHCLLTWEAIASYSSCNEGYKSTNGWITIEAYEKYIVRDILRIRKNTQ